MDLFLHVGAVRHHEAAVHKVSWPSLLDVTTDHISEFELGLVYAFEALLNTTILDLRIFLIPANTFEIVADFEILVFKRLRMSSEVTQGVFWPNTFDQFSDSLAPLSV